MTDDACARLLALVEQTAAFVERCREIRNGSPNAFYKHVDAFCATIDRVLQRVAELPDRTSPDDWPDAMLVTQDELRHILADELAAVLQPHDKLVEPCWDQILGVVAYQAEDEGLWFVAQSASEAYLQQSLRLLHSTIERAAVLQRLPHPDPGDATP